MTVILITTIQRWIGLSSESKPTPDRAGSEFYETDTGATYTYTGAAWALKADSQIYRATKTSATPLTTGTLFTFTGTVEILRVVGRVTTPIANAVTNCKLSVTPDALAAYDICANLNLQQFAAGTLLSITGTAANPMVGTTAVGSIAPAQDGAVVATCVTSGTITVTYGAASAGVIAWEVIWRPLNATGRVVAA